MLMSAGAGDTASLTAQVARRWQAIDPLLPVPGDKSPGCGARLVVAGAGGQPAATGTCIHREGVPESLDLTWGAARGFQLTVRLAGPDAANALDQLLSLWRDHLAGVPGADGEDTAAIVTWPSRDIDGVEALLRHGLAPLAVVAARPTCRHPAGPADGPPRRNQDPGAPAWAADGPPRRTEDPGAPARAADGPPQRAEAAEGAGQVTGTPRPDVRIRRAGPADIDAVVRLGLEVIRFDAHFGSVTERPETADALRREAAGLLAVPGTWTWLAERDGTAIGMLCAERPESAGWIAPMVRPSPVAYLLLMGVLAGERGSGVGAALAAQLHREIDATGVAVTLLHYAQLNPLSVPFWSQQGYRPLWTAWEARPARSIR
jgi:GNAT superfamily N-acetyltransferase